MGLFKKVLSYDRTLKQAEKLADQVLQLESSFSGLTDQQLKDKTAEYKERYKKGETLEQLLPEVFAQVREGAKRVLEMQHYYVQIIGGVVLFQGNIAEMKTGEGKTLVATLPACLNAISGDPSYIVTVNDYLAKRDSEWMGKLYNYLGYTVGLVTSQTSREDKHKAYQSDIIYATNNELGFDYLRDNMVIYQKDIVQRKLSYAIVDEVDSILIDEARTPLIISGASDKSTDMYGRADAFVRTLKVEEDYTHDEKAKTVNLTDKGVKKAEAYFNVENLSDLDNTELNHHINQALKANVIMRRDIDYVVQDGEVLIVDEFPGRIMVGRRYSDGLHQAIEAKEKVNVKRESKTLATITFQNFFRMFDKLAGMTGTAKTEEDEFVGIYNLAVVEIPTNKQMIRQDLNDVVYSTVKGKFNAVIEKIVEIHKTGQPVLVGTVSVENSEILSKMLKMRGIKHEVLNAKNHAKEAEIVAQAGKKGAVTIATNMAGRGTDILLGGNPDFLARQEMRKKGYEEEIIADAVSHAPVTEPEIQVARELYHELLKKHKEITDKEHDEVVKVGGLYILGTERHESRRIDNQLRGRSGRQGDPGTSQFYIALEDDLMRLFGGERVKMIMDKVAKDDNMPLEFGILTKQIENAQKRIEERNYTTRKHVLEYDDVMNKQREIIYAQRRSVLMGEDMKQNILGMLDDVVEEYFSIYCPPHTYPEEWDLEELTAAFRRLFHIEDLELFQGKKIEDLDEKQAKKLLVDLSHELYDAKEQILFKAGVNMREAERVVLLKIVDDKWMDHIDAMDQLKQGIGLRAYAQRNPVVEYRLEGFDMFDAMVNKIKEDTVKVLFGLTIQTKVERKQAAAETSASHGENSKQPVKAEKKVGRNEPCPCGSGKKYKNCCGRNA